MTLVMGRIKKDGVGDGKIKKDGDGKNKKRMGLVMGKV
jgi:hypothetical protein